MATESYKLGPTPFSLRETTYAKAVYPAKDTTVATKTALVTGSNGGIGFACAEWLLELKLSRLIMAVRALPAGEEAANILRKRFPKAIIDVWKVDMLSFDSVQNLSTRCSELDRLDIAILNAGMITDTFKLSPEGHETQFQVNYLSTVLLSTLLLPILKEKTPTGQPGRLTVVGSGAAMQAKFSSIDTVPYLPLFDDRSKWNLPDQYASIKGLLHFWVLKLAEKISADHVVVNVVDPGFVRGTGLHGTLTGPLKLMFWLSKFVMGRTLRDGSSTYIDAAIVKGKESHGSYVMDWKIHSYAEKVYGDKGREYTDRLWNETVEMLDFADIEGVLASILSNENNVK